MKKMKARLWIGLSLIFVSVYAILIVNMASNQRIVFQVNQGLSLTYPSLRHLLEMQDYLGKFKGVYRKGHLFAGSVQDSTKNWQEIHRLDSSFVHSLESNRALANTELDMKLLELLKRSYDEYIGFVKLYVDSANVEKGRYDSLLHQLETMLVEIQTINVDRMKQQSESTERTAINSLNLQRNVGIAGLTILSVFIILFPFVLVAPINRLLNRVQLFYKIELGKEIEMKTEDELEKLEELFKLLIDEVSKKQRDDEKL